MSSNAADPVTLEIANAVARVSLNRPDAGNAMDAPLGRALRDVAESLQKRDDVRAVLLSGNGPRFCVGGDLSYFASSGDIGAALQSLAATYTPPSRPSQHSTHPSSPPFTARPPVPD